MKTVEIGEKKAMNEEQRHIPVLIDEVCSFIVGEDRPLRRIVDGTVGFGGHSSALLRAHPEAELLGVDRDLEALEAAKEALAFAGKRAHLRHGAFSRMSELAAELGWEDGVDAVLLDLGVSSVQLDQADRGFSYRFPEAALDMRMDQNAETPTAADLLNNAPEEELTRIFREYGEVREAGRLAKMVANERTRRPFISCGDFAAVCDSFSRGRGQGGRKGPPAPTLPFQALRIAVNGELDELRRGLEAATELLAPGGRLLAISFHSLEDRIVKRFFQDMAAKCKCPPGLPVCRCGWKPKLAILTKHPIEADEQERGKNSRSACAKLRVAERMQ